MKEWQVIKIQVLSRNYHLKCCFALVSPENWNLLVPNSIGSPWSWTQENCGFCYIKLDVAIVCLMDFEQMILLLARKKWKFKVPDPQLWTNSSLSFELSSLNGLLVKGEEIYDLLGISLDWKKNSSNSLIGWLLTSYMIKGKSWTSVFFMKAHDSF